MALLWNQIEAGMIKIFLIVFSILFSSGSLAASNLICGIDKNNDGYLGDEGETATCIGNDPGLCPIGKLSCDKLDQNIAVPPNKVCPTGTTLQGSMCIGQSSWNEYYVQLASSITSQKPNSPFQPIVWAASYNPSSDFFDMYKSSPSDSALVGSGQEFNVYKSTSNCIMCSDLILDYTKYFTAKLGKHMFTGGSNTNWYSILIKNGNPTSSSPVIDCKIAGYTEKYGFIEYNAQQDKCIFSNVTYTCPVGNGNACVNDGSGYSCSPNKCINVDINKPIDEGDINGGMLVNDGKKTEDGICLDQLYIFSGRGQRCLPSGMSTGYKNCCANKGNALQDNAGSLVTIAGGMATISKMYDVAQKGYQAYNAAITAGKTVSQASTLAGSAMQGQMLVAFDPTSLAISVALHFAMEYFMQACDQESMETAMLASSGYCHYVGEYCKKKVPLLGCVQKAEAYCCFNSMLARIIHEQGRPQLSTIGDFGTAKSPQCRGFTPDEFQSVDFSKIDLSEYIEDMTKKATDQIQGEISETIKDFYDKTN